MSDGVHLWSVASEISSQLRQNIPARGGIVSVWSYARYTDIRQTPLLRLSAGRFTLRELVLVDVEVVGQDFQLCLTVRPISL